HRPARADLRRLLRDHPRPRRSHRRAARADPAGMADDLLQGDAALGARLAGARAGGIGRAARRAGRRRSRGAERRDRPADAPRRRRSRAARRTRRRGHAAGRRGHGCRRSRHRIGRPRLGRLQEASAARLSGARDAQARRSAVMTTVAHGRQIGRSIPRLEAREKVTGRTEYGHHLRLPGMLHGKIFRSTIPHGRIKRIDVSAARALDGVHSVVTIDDIRGVIPHPYYGPAFHDQPILADGKVRFAGEPVAVVLAADRRVAEEAVGLIRAEYEELPAVYGGVEAATSPVLVHDELKPAATFPDLAHLKGRRGTNVALDYQLKRGDPEAAFAAAAHVFQHTFHTQQVMHTPMEPFVAVAVPDADGGALTLRPAA